MGIALLCLTVASTGFVFYERLLHRKKYLEGFTMFAKSCTNEMRSRNESIFSIFSCYAVRELTFLSKLNSGNITDAGSVRKIVCAAGVREDDAFIVTDFLVRLGAGDIESQRVHCEYFAEKFSALLKNAESEIAEKGRLARTLSILGGAALLIVLL